MAIFSRLTAKRLALGFAIGVGVLVGTTGLMLAAAYGLAHSESGRAWMAGALASVLTTPGEAEVTIARLEGDLPGHVYLAGLSVDDRTGTWLTADRVEIDWRPLALLAGKLRVEDVRVRDLRVERAPQRSADALGAEPGGIPVLPFEIAVERLSVQDVTVGPALLGEAATFRIDGEAASRETGVLAATLRIDRTDGGTGGARVDALYDPRETNLALDVALNEPAGGLVARALDVPELAALTVYFSGDGPLTDWRGDLQITLDELASIKAKVALRQADDLDFHVAGSAATVRPASELPWRLMAGDVAFDIGGTWTDDQNLSIAQARLESAAVALRADGQVSLARRTANVRAEAEVKDRTLPAAVLSGATGDGLVVRAEAKGPLAHPTIALTLAADEFALPEMQARGVRAQASFEPDGPLDRAGAQAAVTFSGDAEDFSAAALAEVAPLIGRAIAWNLSGTFDLDERRLNAQDLLLRSGATEVAGGGSLHLVSGEVEAAVRVRFADLAGFSEMLGMAVQGQGDVDARLSATDYGAQMTVALTGHLHDLHVDEPVAQALLAGSATLAAEIARPGDGRLLVRDVAIATPASQLAGEATLSGSFRQLQADYDLRVDDAAVLSPALGLAVVGSAALTGTAAGSARNPGFAGRLAMRRAIIEGVEFGRLEADIQAEDLPGTPRGTIAFTATKPVSDLAGRADFAFRDRAIDLTALNLRGQGVTANGALTVPVTGAPLTGTAKFDVADLAPWLAIGDLDGGGTAQGTVRLAADGPRQTIHLDGQVGAPVWRLGDGTVARAASAALTVRSDDLMGGRGGEVRVQATKVSLGAARLADLSLSAAGDAAAADVRLAATGTWHGPLVARAAGRVHRDAAGVTLDIAEAEGEALGQPIALHGPVTLTQRSDAVALSSLELSFGSARLRAEGKMDTQQIAADVRVESLPLEIFAPIWPAAESGGDLSGTLTLTGPRDDPTGTARLKVSDVAVPGVAEAPPMGLDLSAEWRDRRLALTGQLTGTPERDAELAADLPLVLAAQGLAVRMPAGEPVSGRLSWQGQMASVWPLVPLAGHHLDGAAALELALAGRSHAPEFSGELTLTNGVYENLDTGTVLRDVALRLDLSNTRAVLRELRATDGAGGELTATGEVALDGARRYPFAIDARAVSLAAVRRDDVAAVATGEATFSGTLDQALLRARIVTDSVEVRIIDQLPAEVVVLGVVETGIADKAAAVAGTTESGGELGPDIALDVGLSMPRRVFVRGRGLDSEWAGDVTVTGTAETPIVEGDLRLVRGQMTVLTKVFRLQEGSARFAAGQTMPDLDVTAEHQAQDLTVTARVNGPATNPALTLTSQPMLPRDEIVSRVLFGKTTTQLSAVEGAQLAAAVAELTGTGNGTGRAFDFARGVLGVDVLRLDAGSAQGPGVEAGKYLADDVYLSVKKGVAEESGAVGVEIELTPNISVESETDTTGQSDIGIKFKWDY